MPSWPITEIKELLEPVVAHLGYSIYAVDQLGPGGRTLRISIDKDPAVSIDDCSRVAEVVGPLLDQSEIVPGSYTLEVSSPGAERPIRNRAEYERFVGRRVNVKYQLGPSDGVIEGPLMAVDDGGIAVQGRSGEVMHLAWEDVVFGRLALKL
ncbi:MAG TPA: ribosome maturation factor RimP [Candidatus Dormibacteraeota bacterium]|jgi:ribosome maturation factor RimP|nr:ribosome maturation factor RimP [Candidatus Dormibacteraeota bacterium]